MDDLFIPFNGTETKKRNERINIPKSTSYSLMKASCNAFEVKDNFILEKLTWENEVCTEEMPVLRSNWIELNALFHTHWTICEQQQRKERLEKWANVARNLLTI